MEVLTKCLYHGTDKVMWSKSVWMIWLDRSWRFRASWIEIFSKSVGLEKISETDPFYRSVSTWASFLSSVGEMILIVDIGNTTYYPFYAVRKTAWDLFPSCISMFEILETKNINEYLRMMILNTTAMEKKNSTFIRIKAGSHLVDPKKCTFFRNFFWENG